MVALNQISLMRPGTASVLTPKAGTAKAWMTSDAVPGRINEIWFKANKEGLYYGQCSELCGKDHAFMPIAIRVVSDAQYTTWLAAARTDLTGANKALMAAVDGAEPVAVAGN